MKKIEGLWQSLESSEIWEGGLLYKRLLEDILPNIYVSVKYPERLRCIAIHLSKLCKFDTNSWNKFKDIKIETFPDEKNPEKYFLLIVLLNNQHRDIFSTLSEDLIYQVADITEEKKLTEALLFRLEKWSSIFDKIGSQGLSEQAQRGLYGELFFLRKYLQNSDNYIACINSWKGPDKAVQDFQYSSWAVEVKTTHGKNHQKLQISSERQLDTSFVPTIFLYHLSLEVRQSHGENLNQIVSEIAHILALNPVAENSFKAKLLEAGYFDIHSYLYEENGFSIRQEIIYQIKEDFPRIIERNVPSGVGDVRYSLIISDTQRWSISENKLFDEIKAS